MITISPDIAEGKRYLQQLDRTEIPRVIGRTLDRTKRFAATRTNRAIRERVNLKRATVDAAIKTRRSGEIGTLTALSAGRAWFEVVVSGKPIPLRDFSANQTKRGVTYRVSKSVGRRLYRRAGQNSFIVKRIGGHVFTRTGPDPKGPLTVPIKKVYGPSLPQYFSTKRIQRPIIQETQNFWNRDLIANARFALSKRK